MNPEVDNSYFYFVSMINKTIFLTLYFSLLLCSCSRQEKQQRSFDFIPPEVVEAKAYIVPQEKMAPPEISSVKEVKRKAVSKPKVIPFHSNVFPASKPRTVVAGAPKICVPGHDGFHLAGDTQVLIVLSQRDLPKSSLEKTRKSIITALKASAHLKCSKALRQIGYSPLSRIKQAICGYPALKVD
jgi:hypothetical protein